MITRLVPISKIRCGVFVAEGGEGLARLVGGERRLAQVELLVPELQDALNAVEALVAVREDAVVLLLRVRTEELTLFQGAVVVEVRLALLLGQQLRRGLAEVLVAARLDLRIPLEDVVEAVGVGVTVWAEAATADGVVDEDVLLALAPAEEHLRPVGFVAVAVVGEVFHVGVHDALRVVDVPAVGDHQDGERFIPQTQEAEALGLRVVDGSFEDGADLFLGERVGAAGGVVLPLVLLRQTLQKIEHAGVVLVRDS